jgi:hypothetical protein
MSVCTAAGIGAKLFRVFWTSRFQEHATESCASPPMSEVPEKKPIDDWNGQRIELGETRDVTLAVSESYSGITVQIPLQIRRGPRDGPTVFVTAALHGDEINGTGAVRNLIQDPGLQLTRGNLILVPVLNILSFDRHARYLPDRRDLNRCFPGSARGSLASRMARTIFDEIVLRSDYGIDLHTAAIRRTNYPTVRGDMGDDGVRRLAEAFGCEIIMNARGPQGALRREACAAGCPTIIMEGGEVWKVEPAIVATAVRGVTNVLRRLGMLDGQPDPPRFATVIEKTKWVRAERGGFLRFHVKPGDLVETAQPLATNTDLLGHERNVLQAPFDSIVLGMTTLPAVCPGEPVCHLGRLPHGMNGSQVLQFRDDRTDGEDGIAENFSSRLLVVDPAQPD